MRFLYSEYVVNIVNRFLQTKCQTGAPSKYVRDSTRLAALSASQIFKQNLENI